MDDNSFDLNEINIISISLDLHKEMLQDLLKDDIDAGTRSDILTEISYTNSTISKINSQCEEFNGSQAEVIYISITETKYLINKILDDAEADIDSHNYAVDNVKYVNSVLRKIKKTLLNQNIDIKF